MHSLTEENYLKAIYKLSAARQDSGGDISNTLLAEAMSVKASSVTDMLRRLSEKGLITYQRYKGLHLSEDGKSVALQVIRRHRLWEVFLVDKLGFAWDEVHDIAEQLEHIQSRELVNRLDDLLGNPAFDPHGDPIPDRNGQLISRAALPLNDLDTSSRSVMCGVADHSEAFLQMLGKVGLGLGKQIVIISREEYDSSLFIAVNEGSPFFISQRVAENILVEV